MKLLLVVLVVFIKSSYAPFPEEHPYNWVNPYIEPWWKTLEKQDQEEVFQNWKLVEPYMSALARWKDRWERQIEANTKTIQTGVVAYASRLDELRKALLGKEDVPPKPGYPDYWPSEEDWLTEEETRNSGKAQVAWEDFQAAFQHALHLKLSEDRARYQKLLEVMRLIKWKTEAKKAAIKNSRDEIAARLKKLTESQEEYSPKNFDIRELMLEKIAEFREKGNELLWKLQGKKEEITDVKKNLWWKIDEKRDEVKGKIDEKVEQLNGRKEALLWKIDNTKNEIKEEVKDKIKKIMDKEEELLWKIGNTKDKVKGQVGEKLEKLNDRKEELLWKIDNTKETVKEEIGHKLGKLKKRFEDGKEKIKSKLWQEDEKSEEEW